jgi:predicted RNase H-like HicB family nuclease
MRYAGRISRQGRFWAAEVPVLHVYTQGRTKREAFEMVADAIEMLVDREGFQVDVHPGDAGYFEVGSDDEAGLVALLLRQQRIGSGLTLVEVARRLEARSHNAYARYEQGHCVPTIEKLAELLGALGSDIVLDISSLS